ncbi:MAG: NAD-dependent deacylase [Chloroflexi bacterium]|nr:NAD-dependent deacylase [Chloroflexota bacterium]
MMLSTPPSPFAENITQAAQVLANASRIVCLTGAGVSAESGVATFRDAQTGLWSHFNPQQLASQAGFAADPGLVWRWYMQRLQTVEAAAPNLGHIALTQLAQLTPSFTLITQNVDDIHERAGSGNSTEGVLHIHGSITQFRCNVCGFEHVLQPFERVQALPPICRQCQQLVRPAVVWFGEALPERVSALAQRAVAQCDVMLVVGTSGVVYPVAEWPYAAQQNGATVIDVNPICTPISAMADLFLQGPGGEILPTLLEVVQQLRASN